MRFRSSGNVGQPRLSVTATLYEGKVPRFYDAAEFTESHNNLSNTCPNTVSRVNRLLDSGVLALRYNFPRLFIVPQPNKP